MQTCFLYIEINRDIKELKIQRDMQRPNFLSEEIKLDQKI